MPRPGFEPTTSVELHQTFEGRSADWATRSRPYFKFNKINLHFGWDFLHVGRFDLMLL